MDRVGFCPGIAMKFEDLGASHVILSRAFGALHAKTQNSNTEMGMVWHGNIFDGMLKHQGVVIIRTLRLVRLPRAIMNQH